MFKAEQITTDPALNCQYCVSDVWVSTTERRSIQNKQAKLKVSKRVLSRIHINYVNNFQIEIFFECILAIKFVYLLSFIILLNYASILMRKKILYSEKSEQLLFFSWDLLFMHGQIPFHAIFLLFFEIYFAIS